MSMVDRRRERWQAVLPFSAGVLETQAMRARLSKRCRRDVLGGADELGLAALFESWGITDITAKRIYGCDDVFSLACWVREDLGSGSAPTDPGQQRVPLITPTWFLRGATYLPPTVFVIIALSDAVVPASGVAFAIITCLGWGCSEAVSRVAYGAINRGGPGAIRRTYRYLLALGTPMVAAVACAVGLLSGSVGAGLLIGAQLLYLLAAIVLLPLDGERMLLFWIVPALVVGLVLAGDVDRIWLILVIALAGEFAALAAAAVHLHRLEPAVSGAPGRTDVVEASPFLVSGVSMGAFVLACTAVVLQELGSRAAMVALVVPLMLSMGCSEIGIRRFQGVVSRDLARSVRLEDFGRRARRAVVLYCGMYVATLVVLDVLAGFVFPLPRTGLVVEAYVLLGLLGLSLFLTLVLMVMDHVVPVVVGYAFAALLVLAMILLGVAGENVMWGTIVAAGAVACSLFLAAVVAVGHPANHGFD